MSVVFPDVEAELITALTPLLPGVWVSNEHPGVEPSRAGRMVIVRDDSGNQLDAVREIARLGVQTWATTRADAKDLAEQTRTILNQYRGGPIKHVRCVMRPVFVQDAQPLFYATYEAVIYGRNQT